MDGISSDLEEPAEGDEEEEEEERGTGSCGLQEGSPHTPDQEQFLKQHFETLANGAAPGVVRGPAFGHCSLPFAPPCLAEREGPRAGHGLGLLARGGRIWGKGLLQFVISVTLTGGPVRVPERTESRSISSRFLLQVQTPPLRYLSSQQLSLSCKELRLSSPPCAPNRPILPLGQHTALLSKASVSPCPIVFCTPSFGTTGLAGFVPALLS